MAHSIICKIYVHTPSTISTFYERNLKYWIVRTFAHTHIHIYIRFVCKIYLIWENTHSNKHVEYTISPVGRMPTTRKTLKKFANPFWNITIVFPFYKDIVTTQLWKRAFWYVKAEPMIPEYIICCWIQKGKHSENIH